MDSVSADLRFAIRAYRRNPGVAVAIVVTLGLCIGAGASIFSVISRVLLRPLPYATPDALVTIIASRTSDGTPTRASYAELADWRKEQELFSAVEAYDETNVSVALEGDADFVGGARVTSGFFQMLGVPLARGGPFTAEDDATGAGGVILSNDFWVNRFGADPTIVGRFVFIDGARSEVRGVLPPRFRFAPAGNAQLWLPVGRNAQLRASRSSRWLNAVARLRDGVTPSRAAVRMRSLMGALAREFPETDLGRTVTIAPLRDQVVGGVERPLSVLFGAVVILLLIACVNIANLVLARIAERERELAVRSALGAARWRLVRQLVIENFALALMGGALGVAVAMAGVPSLSAVVPATLYEQTPALKDISVDAWTLAFALAVTTFAAVAFSVAPAVLSTRAPAVETLRSGGRGGTSRDAQHVRRVLVSAEIALTTMLLVSAGLVTRSFVSLLRVNPGFDPTNVATVRAALTGARYADERRQVAFFQEALARAANLPGVGSVGATSSLPLLGSARGSFVIDDGARDLPNAKMEAATRVVAGSYFRTLRIPIREGRVLDDRDRAESPAAVVLNESLARRLFPRQSAVGHRIRFDGDTSTWIIVGVVGDVKTGSLDESFPPTIYFYHLQKPANRMSIVVRTALDPVTLISALRRQIREIDATVATYAAGTLTGHLRNSPAVAARRYPLVLIGAFAASALLLAVVGVYGVIAYGIAQRQREIAIRLALGATAEEVIAMFVVGGLRLLLYGGLLGLIGATAVSGALSSMLFNVHKWDPVTYLSVLGALSVVTISASYAPSRRLSVLDPALALRSD